MSPISSLLVRSILMEAHADSSSLQVMSKQINTELDEQNMMLDDLGNDIESTQNKVDIALKKMAKVRTPDS